MSILESLEQSFREGYDAGYQNGVGDATSYDRGWPTHESVAKRERDEAWNDSEAKKNYVE